MADTGLAGQLRSLTGQQVPGVAIAIAGPEGLRDQRQDRPVQVEQATIREPHGQPYITLAREEILAPLGMHLTGFTYTSDMQARATTGYHPRRSPLRLLLPRWVIGDPAGHWVSFRRFLPDGAAYGGLLGPVHDAARFLQMHLRDGELDGARILAAESAAAMRRITTNGRRFDLGLGWFRPASQRHADPPFVEHLGGGAGFFNLIRIYPTQGVGIAIMGNATKYNINAVASLALSRT